MSDLGIPADPGHFDLEVSGDGLEVYLLIADRLLVFDRNVSTGSLALSQIFDEPTVQAISSNFEGDGVFLNEPSNKEIRLLRRDPLTNNLSPVATIARGYRVDSFWPQTRKRSSRRLTAGICLCRTIILRAGASCPSCCSRRLSQEICNGGSTIVGQPDWIASRCLRMPSMYS